MSALSDFGARKGMNGQVDWKLLGPFFWGWFHDHSEDMILKRKIFFFSVTIRVRDLYPLFVQLFGPEVNPAVS